jgi:hypothetical protein
MSASKLAPLALAGPLLLLAACAETPEVAPAGRALEPGCSELGDTITEHACFHATNGPFQTVPASATRVFTAPTPNVNTVHTQFNVVLPAGSEGTVKYRPARSGDWAIFTDPSVSLQVLDPAGAVLPVALTHAVAGCEHLSQVSVVGLTANTTYRVVFAPGPSTVGVVVEKLSDFEGFYYADTRDQPGCHRGLRRARQRLRRDG